MKHEDWCAKTARPHDPLQRGYVGEGAVGPGVKGKLVAEAACTCSSNGTARLLNRLRDRGVLRT